LSSNPSLVLRGACALIWSKSALASSVVSATVKLTPLSPERASRSRTGANSANLARTASLDAAPFARAKMCNSPGVEVPTEEEEEEEEEEAVAEEEPFAAEAAVVEVEEEGAGCASVEMAPEGVTALTEMGWTVLWCFFSPCFAAAAAAVVVVVVVVVVVAGALVAVVAVVAVEEGAAVAVVGVVVESAEEAVLEPATFAHDLGAAGFSSFGFSFTTTGAILLGSAGAAAGADLDSDFLAEEEVVFL